MSTFYPENDYRNYLKHYGVKGMRWRNRRASSRNVDDQRNRHRVNLLRGSSWNANGTDRRNHSNQESTETGRQNGHYYNRNSWLQRQHDETVHEHDSRNRNKRYPREDIPHVDDKSIFAPTMQRGHRSGRHQRLSKFGHKRRH